MYCDNEKRYLASPLSYFQLQRNLLQKVRSSNVQSRRRLVR